MTLVPTTPWITRVECVSAAGFGLDALTDAARAGRPLAKPVPWAVDTLRSPFAALAHAGDAEEMLLSVVGAVAPGEGAGLVVATSSGAISGPFERWHRAARAAGEPATTTGWRQLPAQNVARRFGLAPFTTVSVACASGTSAFEIARGWLRAGRCSRVVVAGVDALSLYIHAGFGGLGALAREACRPFAADRDGLMLGEGAAAFLLETPAAARAAGRAPLVALLGCGLSQDGVHLTAPDRTGAGLARAANRALADAGVAAGDVGAVSAHGTGTVFNDAMEARALATVFGDMPVPLHAVKGVIGHTLGAAGALEAALLIALLRGAEAPAPPAVDAPDCPLVPAPTRDPRIGMSVSAAFGGVNAAVVFGPVAADAGPPSSVVFGPVAADALDGDALHAPRRAAPHGGGVAGGLAPPPQEAPDPDEPVALAEAALSTDDLPLARVFPGASPALGRTDAYVRAGIAVLAELRAGLDADTAVVLASPSNCHAADVRYHAGLVDGGPPHASRLHFSYTVPGGPVAEAAILLGLRGPVHVLCDDAAAATVEARRLVREGMARTAVALVVEAPEAWATATATVFRSP